jgi:hypothetical protein
MYETPLIIGNSTLAPARGPPSDEEDLKEDGSDDDDALTDVPLKTSFPSRLPERPSNIRLPGGPTSKSNISGPRSPQKSPQKSPVKVVKKSSATSSEEIETKGTTRQNGGTAVTSPRKSPVKKAKSEDNKEARKGKREARGDPPEDNEDKQE